MRLAFLCSSLAAGRDGVGDYVRRLAAACAAQGHVCRAIALHDRHLAAGATLLEQEGELRLGAGLPWARRTRLLADALARFAPDWVSWQVVAYGFHPKGLLPSGCLRAVETVRPWRSHLMLHELWLGLAREDGPRARLLGAWQRRRLLGFVRALRPAALHTSNGPYQAALARHGWTAERLPVFGNIPVGPEHRDETPDAPLLRGRPLVAAFFGTVHPQWRPEAAAALLRRTATATGRPLTLLAVGRSGVSGAARLAEVARTCPDSVVKVLGPQAPETVSRLLQGADLGLATHPWALIEKSGSTATLLEHGLPVLVLRDDWHGRAGGGGPAPDPLLGRLADFTPETLAAWLRQRRPAASRLPAVAARFLAALGAPTPCAASSFA